jgi:hypothetical protein
MVYRHTPAHFEHYLELKSRFSFQYPEDISCRTYQHLNYNNLLSDLEVAFLLQSFVYFSATKIT